MVKGFVLVDTSSSGTTKNKWGPIANVTDEVQLVQLGYLCMGTNPKAQMSADDRAIFSAAVPGALYDGSADDPRSVAIRA